MERVEVKVLLLDAIAAAIKAGKEILDIYENSNFDVEMKADNSPLTIADKRSHNVIMHELKETGIPILSEEGKNINYKDREPWRDLWIVDPLDGTKEFIKQNGEFTVNIALCERGVPVLGVIYVPVSEDLYFAGEEYGAFKKEKAAHGDLPDTLDELIASSTRLPELQERPFTLVGSRSHMNQETLDYLEKMREQNNEVEIISKGSSLKICMVAEGSADVYPRFAPTMEWDTAAGHAIAKQAGFEMYQAKQGDKPLCYNKEDLLNPWFIVKKKI